MPTQAIVNCATEAALKHKMRDLDMATINANCSIVARHRGEITQFPHLLTAKHTQP